MQLVVVMAVRKAVSAATITFTATSINPFFLIVQSSMFNDLLVWVFTVAATTVVASGVVTALACSTAVAAMIA